MIEIKDVELALDKGNRISALTMLRQLPLQEGNEAYKRQAEFCITANELEVAKKCLEIMDIKEKYPKIRDADEQPLKAATAMLDATTASFGRGDCEEEDLEKAVDYLYVCLLDMIKEERGLA